MMSFLSGVIFAGAGGASLWYFRPRQGQVHRLAVMPFLDSMIPVGIVSSLAFGVALIIASIAALFN